jgi:hypothetical protein
MRVGYLDIMRRHIPLIEGVGLIDFHRLNVLACISHIHRASLYELLQRFCHINTNYKNLKADSFLAKNHSNAIRSRLVGVTHILITGSIC